MCKKCDEISGRISHYKRLATSVSDQQALDAIAGLIAQGEADRAAFRCEPITARTIAQGL